MIEQHARVIAVEGDTVVLQTETQSACGGCQANSTCGTGLLAKLFPERARQPLHLPVAGLSRPLLPGQRVVLGIDESYLRHHMLLLYAVPLLGLLGGAILGDLWGGGHAVGGASELAAILGGLSGLTAAVFWVRWRTSGNAARIAHSVRILRVEPGTRSVPVQDIGLHA